MRCMLWNHDICSPQDIGVLSLAQWSSKMVRTCPWSGWDDTWTVETSHLNINVPAFTGTGVFISDLDCLHYFLMISSTPALNIQPTVVFSPLLKPFWTLNITTLYEVTSSWRDHTGHVKDSRSHTKHFLHDHRLRWGENWVNLYLSRVDNKYREHLLKEVFSQSGGVNVVLFTHTRWHCQIFTHCWSLKTVARVSLLKESQLEQHSQMDIGQIPAIWLRWERSITSLFVRTFQLKYITCPLPVFSHGVVHILILLEKFFQLVEVNNDMNHEGVTITEQTPTLPEYKRLWYILAVHLIMLV